MSVPFPEPTGPSRPRAEVLLDYLDYFRGAVLGKVEALPESAHRASPVPSGWTPLELIRHLAFVELRWLEWGFEGREVSDPWGDERAGRWFVDPQESLAGLSAELLARGQRTREIVGRHELTELGRPGERWDGAAPASLERILFHLVQEYARHAGHLDIVAELLGGQPGE